MATKEIPEWEKTLIDKRLEFIKNHSDQLIPIEIFIAELDKGDEAEFVISEEQKVLVNEELREIEENPNYLLDWDDVKHQLKFD